jgi:hypothetical protein
MRALGTVLSGIVDDSISDAYRNPARIGDVSGVNTKLYAGLQPDRALSLAFPEFQSDFYDPVPTEGFYLYSYTSDFLIARNYRPLSFSLFTRLRDKLPLSATVEIAVSGDDDLDDNSYVRPDHFPIIEDIEGRELDRTHGQDLYHAQVDLALSGSTPRENSRSTGVRMTARYDTYEWYDTFSRNWIEAQIENPTELESDLYATVQRKKFEEFDASVNFGLFRPGSVVREVIAGAGITKQTGSQNSGRVDIFDQDYDGNGEDPYGFRPVYTYERGLFESNRDYRIFRVFGAAIFAWRPWLRTKHGFSWSEGNGDGSALYRVDDEIYDGFVNEFYNESVDNIYDGDTRRYTATSTIGFVNEVFEGITFAAGTDVSYINSEFEENADGDADVGYVRPETTLTVESPFRQRIWYTSDQLYLHVPASVEWEVNSYLNLRVGLFFNASRREIEVSERQSADLLGVQLPFDHLSLHDGHYVVYATGVSSVLGFTVNLRERLVLDFLDTSTSDLGFSNLTVTYTF